MESKPKICGFDFIKIIIASFIVLHHYQQIFGCKFNFLNFYGGRILFGYFVELFFTLSGFLTLYSDQRHMSAGGGQRLVHRLLRIYPMVFISILTCLILKTILYFITADEQLINLWNVKTLVANFGLLFAGYPYFEMTGINNPVWYVCILIQCYLLYYFLEWLFEKCNCQKSYMLRLATYMVVISSSVILFHCGFLNGFSFRGLTSFFIGVLICIVNQRLAENHIINRNNRKLISVIFITLSMLFCGLILLGIEQRYVLQFLVFPSLVIGVINLDIPKLKILSDLADVSFEVFIIHYPLMVVVKLIMAVTCISLNHSYMTMGLFLIICWGVAWLMWKYIDLPIRNITRSFEKT